MGKPIVSYVLGFLYDDSRVALIQKIKPKWQYGMLNGIGERLSFCEIPTNGMQRKFKEEAGIDLHEDIIERFLTILRTDSEDGNNYNIYVFRAKVDLSSVKSTTDETICLVDKGSTLAYAAPHMQWIFPMVFDKTIKESVVHLI